jgi:hypothetical protein
LDSAESPASGRLGHLIRVHADYLAKTRAYFNVFTPLKSYLVSPLCLAPNLDHWAVRGRDWKAGIARIVDRSRQVMAPAREGALKLKEWLKSARDEMSTAGLGPEDTEADTNAQAPEPSDPLPRIQALRRLGRVRTAWTHLRAALAQAPDNPDLLMEAARIVFMRERVRAAEELAAEVETRRPGCPDARRLRKDIAAALVDWEKRARLALERDDWITTLLLTRKIRAARPDHQPALDLEQAALARRAEREREAKADRSFTTANAPSPPHPAPVETIIQAAPPAISDSSEASRPSVVKHHGAG